MARCGHYGADYDKIACRSPARQIAALKALFKPLSLAPLWALYVLSWVIYMLAYYLARYRHRVIREQLAKVFPNATEAERTAIHKRFLKNFCDVLVELVKSMSISSAAMIARVRVADLQPLRSPLEAGRSVMLVTSHLGNWEWLLQGVTLQLGHPVEAAYKPLKNLWAERLVLEVRSRFGARLIPAKDLLADFLRRRGVVRALAMNADQAPVSTDKRYWTRFLGQDTAFYVGAEQIARAMRLPVFYLLMRRASRGRYEVEIRELWDGREPLEPNAITERYARICETDVMAHPADWLWSYRRWKLQKPLYGAD
jgi:Kdo2-lipid IVA lauroyltransferase/acyltransferase